MIPGIKESHPELFEMYGRVALNGRPEKLEIEFKPLEAWLSISVFSIEKNHFIAIFDNITMRKQNERVIEDLDTRLKQKMIKVELANEALEAYSYSISHDLRAPLRHMSGFADLLQKRLKNRLDDDDMKYLYMISVAAKNMDRLINALLSYSRLGRDEMKKNEVDLNRLLKESVDQIADDTNGRDIIWNIGKLPVVYGEKSLLKLVLVNLISNALKFSSNRSPAEIEIGCNKSAGEDICFIRDNGVGFSMEHAVRLFGVFQRLHPQSEFEGTGIGLANVRRIIALHGGRTWAEGVVDKGATFYFALPK
jgi:light-regulated signal transduction histidine kinase (bacteriophytochrome)